MDSNRMDILKFLVNFILFVTFSMFSEKCNFTMSMINFLQSRMKTDKAKEVYEKLLATPNIDPSLVRLINITYKICNYTIAFIPLFI
jgi:hypothetical protein